MKYQRRVSIAIPAVRLWILSNINHQACVTHDLTFRTDYPSQPEFMTKEPKGLHSRAVHVVLITMAMCSKTKENTGIPRIFEFLRNFQKYPSTASLGRMQVVLPLSPSPLAVGHKNCRPLATRDIIRCQGACASSLVRALFWTRPLFIICMWTMHHHRLKMGPFRRLGDDPAQFDYGRLAEMVIGYEVSPFVCLVCSSHVEQQSVLNAAPISAIYIPYCWFCILH